MRRRLASVGALTLGVVMLATPSAWASTTGAKVADPCAVLDPTVIAAATGGQVSAPEPGKRYCQWNVTMTVPEGTASLIVFVGISKYTGTAKREVPQNAKASSAVKIPGVKGAKYAFYDLSLSPPIAQVVKHKQVANVQIGPLADDATTGAALATLTKEVAKSL
jgi:hypothetical protein